MPLYAIGLGSNRRHRSYGAPGGVVRAAIAALDADGLVVAARSPIVATAPIGLRGRRFANAAILAESALGPAALLARLKMIERRFGRRRGRRWDSRVVDLDILLWSGDPMRQRDLVIPHPSLARRRFVLDPLAAIVPHWRAAPGLAVRHLRTRLTRPVPVHRSGPRSGP